ncbi:MAG TPA: tetratricopeptide repeat protein [Xanthobacteraceae bacterium]|nr:tetratricopeptide repeat protein [Xanthobacteraceae bacterium]
MHMPTSRRAEFLAALEHCWFGRQTEAEAAFETLIAQNPDDGESLTLLAMLRMERDPDAAEALLSRCVALSRANFFALHYLGKLTQRRADHRAAIDLFRRAAAGNPNFAPTHNDLGASLHEIGERSQALAAFDRAIAIDPDYTTAHSNRGLLLAEMRRPAEARDAFRRVIAATSESADAWQNIGTAHYNLAEFDQSIAACRRAIALDPSHLDAYATLAQALGRVHRIAEADQVRAEWARRQGVLTAPCESSRADARILLIGGAEFCNVPTQHLFDRHRFEIVSIYLMPPGMPADPATSRERLPPFDIVFNAIGDADRGEPYVSRALEFCRGLGRPILNAPDRIAQTRRDRLPALLGEIPGLAIPGIRRIARADLVALAATDEARWPKLLRPIGSHGGDDLKRIERPDEVAAYVDAVPADEYYLSDFCDFRSLDGYFRKYRLIFVDRAVYPYHVAIANDWLVHYWRAEMTDWMKQEEEEFLADWRSVFSPAAAAAVTEVARRLDLDYAGMDCAILPDGRVLLFEANATMLVHLKESRAEFAYKHAYVPRIIEAMTALVNQRVARADAAVGEARSAAA